jgi:hypothetical protein
LGNDALFENHERLFGIASPIPTSKAGVDFAMLPFGKFFSPSAAYSRPKPDSFAPPNGIDGSGVTCWFTHAVPTSRRAAMATARFMLANVFRGRTNHDPSISWPTLTPRPFRQGLQLLLLQSRTDELNANAPGILYGLIDGLHDLNRSHRDLGPQI